MTLKSDAKFKKKHSCGFKYNKRNLLNFTQPLKSLKASFRWVLFVQSMQDLSYKNTEALFFITLNCDSKFE